MLSTRLHEIHEHFFSLFIDPFFNREKLFSPYLLLTLENRVVQSFRIGISIVADLNKFSCNFFFN